MWQFASLSTTTGTPSCSAITSPNAMSLSGTLTACTAMPVRESNVQGMPKPIAVDRPADRRADLLHGVGDHLHEFVLRETVDRTVGTVDHRQVRADRACQQLRAAEVDADDVALGHRRPPYRSRHGRPSRRRQAPVHALPRQARSSCAGAATTAACATCSRTRRRGFEDAPPQPPRAARAAPPAAAAGSASGASCAGCVAALVAWLADLARALPGLRPDPVVEGLRAPPTPSSAARATR